MSLHEYNSEHNNEQPSVVEATTLKPKLKDLQQMEQLRLLYELRLYSLQRIICLGTAVWLLLQTGDIMKFLLIMAAGFMNIQWAMRILASIIRTETIEDRRKKKG